MLLFGGGLFNHVLAATSPVPSAIDPWNSRFVKATVLHSACVRSHLVRLTLETWVSNLWYKFSLTTCVILSPGVCPPTGLIAQRINVYRGMGSYKPTAGLTGEGEGDAKVSDACYLHSWILKFDTKVRVWLDFPFAVTFFFSAWMSSTNTCLNCLNPICGALSKNQK